MDLVAYLARSKGEKTFTKLLKKELNTRDLDSLWLLGDDDCYYIILIKEDI